MTAYTILGCCVLAGATSAQRSLTRRILRGSLDPMHRHVAAGTLVFSLGACADDARPPLVWEGDLLSFYTDEEMDSVCSGTLPYADALLAHLAIQLDGQSPPGRVDYHWIPEGLDAHCAPTNVGCTLAGRQVYSKYVLHQHELVHAVRSNVAYLPLEEGVAELFGDDWDPFAPFPDSLDLEMMMRIHEGTDEFSAQWYAPAGFLASHFRHEYGIASFVDFLNASRRGDSWKTTQLLFEDHFGGSIADILVSPVAGYPDCDQTFYRDNSFECTGGPDGTQAMVPTSPDAFELKVDLGCAESGVLGPRRGEIWKTSALEVSEGGYYEVGLSKIGGVKAGRARIRQCGQSCATPNSGLEFPQDALLESVPSAPVGDDRFHYTLCIHPGVYSVRFSIDEGDDAAMVLWLRRYGAQSC